MMNTIRNCTGLRSSGPGSCLPHEQQPVETLALQNFLLGTSLLGPSRAYPQHGCKRLGATAQTAAKNGDIERIEARRFFSPHLKLIMHRCPAAEHMVHTSKRRAQQRNFVRTHEVCCVSHASIAFEMGFEACLPSRCLAALATVPTGSGRPCHGRQVLRSLRQQLRTRTPGMFKRDSNKIIL